MKLKLIFVGLVAILMISSCSNTKTEEVTNPETTVKEDKVETKTTTTTSKNSDGTSLEVNSNSVSFGKKNGGNETSVKISSDSSNLTIKRK